MFPAPRDLSLLRRHGGQISGQRHPVEQGFLNYVLHEPLGVVGQIVPWNFPLMFTS